MARIPATAPETTSQSNGFGPNDYEEWEQLPVEDQGGWESVGQGSSELFESWDRRMRDCFRNFRDLFSRHLNRDLSMLLEGSLRIFFLWIEVIRH